MLRWGAIGALAVGAAGCVDDAAPPVNGPPAPLPEIVSGPVVPGMVWVAGCWHWDGEGYVWLPGHWMSPPKGEDASAGVSREHRAPERATPTP